MAPNNKGVTVRIKTDNGDWETVNDAAWDERFNTGEFIRHCIDQWLKENRDESIEVKYQ